MIKLSIIIVNWNTASLLGQCLNSLKSEIQNPKFKIEIIVVDNGSTDRSIEAIKDLGFKNYDLKIIENKENYGFAKGNNISLKRARGEYIMLLNTDTIVKEGAIEKLIKVLDTDPEIGAVSPLVLNPDGTIQKDPCYLNLPSPLFVFFYYNRFLKYLANRFFPKLLYSVTDFKQQSCVQQLPGAAMMIKKTISDKIDGFDESFGIYFEDTDLCVRIRKEGFKLLFEPNAEIVHLGRQSIKPVINQEGIEKFYFLNFQSLFHFCKKHYPLTKSWTIKAIVLAQMLLTGRFALFKKLLSA